MGKALERAERNVYRCDNIIEELLDYTRVRELDLEQTAVDDWFAEVLDEYQFPDGIVVTHDFTSGATVNFEQDSLHRCIVNLLNNACQAMDSGAVSQHEKLLKLSTGMTNGRVEIQITDTGPGMPEDKLEKIFEPLFSTKVYGVGLGLSIVKQIMEQHNGGIDIFSEEGEGTQVRLWLPIEQQEERQELETGENYETGTNRR